nr:LPXTG cell wall anchor domain-containing protein [Clostridia bacterium]
DGYQEITPATMSIDAVDYEGIYDGQSHEGGVTGDVPDGSVVLYSTDGGQTWSPDAPSITDVGSEDYLVLITNSNYFDATADGTLTVNLRPVTVTADPKSKVYATADPELTATEENLVAGESLDYELYRDAGENVGSYNISFEFVADQPSTVGFFDRIMKVFQPKTQTAIMGNYEVQFVDGEFDITPMPLTITAASDEKVYDGTPLTNSNYTYTALAEGDTLVSVTVTGSQTEVGSSPNTPSDAKIQNAAGEDVTANYDITYEKGSLVVTAPDNPPEPPKPPETGDDNHLFGWTGLAGLAIAGLAALLFAKKREEETE